MRFCAEANAFRLFRNAIISFRIRKLCPVMNIGNAFVHIPPELTRGRCHVGPTPRRRHSRTKSSRRGMTRFLFKPGDQREQVGCWSAATSSARKPGSGIREEGRVFRYSHSPIPPAVRSTSCEQLPLNVTRILGAGLACVQTGYQCSWSLLQAINCVAPKRADLIVPASALRIP
jgi:hypothetical protein